MPRVVHFEIHAGDPKRAANFYQQLFGWTFTRFEGGPMPYWVINTGDESIGINGGLHPRRGDGNAEVNEVIGYVCTINVASLDASLERVTRLGGSICRRKMNIPNIGDLAYCKDTEGNVFGMLEPRPAR